MNTDNFDRQLELRIEKHAKRTPGGLTIAKKKILREHYLRGEKDNNRDYVYGHDEGEEKIIKYK